MLPQIRDIKVARGGIPAFAGLDARAGAPSGSFAHMVNLSPRRYPLASPRLPRMREGLYGQPQGICAEDPRCIAAGGALYVGETYAAAITPGEKQILRMGAYVLVWPDGLVYNTKTGQARHANEERAYAQGVDFSLARADGEAYENYTVGPDQPPSPADGAYWVDTSALPHTLKRYAGASGVWTVIVSTYIRIAAPGIGGMFQAGDDVKLSGTPGARFDATFPVVEHGQDFIVVPGICEEAVLNAAATFSRAAPPMDFLCVHDNRVWGCSNATGQIYACKLGSPWNWNSFTGLASDSYALQVGSPGAFTGIAAHLGYVLFFKEARIHKLFGTRPQNFQLSEMGFPGVEAGSHSSLCALGGLLYYKSPLGICAYGGGAPEVLSQPLGGQGYRHAIAGACAGRYFVSMEHASGSRRLFVYTPERRLWHEEDDPNPVGFSTSGAQGHLLTHDGALLRLEAQGEAFEEEVAWSAETAPIGVTLENHKYMARPGLRLWVGAGAEVRLEVEYDSDGLWHAVAAHGGTPLRAVRIPLPPRRCDHFRLRLSGRGDCGIYALQYEIAEGSEV